MPVPLPDLSAPPEIDIVAKRTIFQSYFRVDEYKMRHGRFDGGWTAEMTREVFERGHAAALLPYDPQRDTFVLCQQFRIGAYAAGMDPWQIECVAGIIEPDETAEEVARRETVEEAGCTVLDLVPIQRYLVSPGGSSESVALYLGRVSSENAGGIFGLPEENEHIRVFTVTTAQMRALMENGAVTNAATLLAMQWYFLNRERIATLWKA